MVKNLPAVQEAQETWARSLVWEDPLEEEGNSNPPQYSHLGNPMDRGAWWATGPRATESRPKTAETRFSKNSDDLR